MFSKGVILKSITFAIVLIAVSLYWFVSTTIAPVLSAGSGYSAKQICSGHFLSGFEPELMKEQALVPATEILSNVTYEIDEISKRVDARIFGMFPRTAAYSDEVGCTLWPANSGPVTHNVQAISAPDYSTSVVWPSERVDSSGNVDLSGALDRAFEEIDGEVRKQTKAVVVIHNGQIVAEHYADGVSVDTPLIGWSMSKSVTNLLVGLAVKNNVLDIHEPANLPQWTANPDDPRREITTDQLLRMSSGLEFNESYGILSDVTMMLSIEPDMAHFAASKPLEHAPDEHWNYSSGTSNILTHILFNRLGEDPQAFYEFTEQNLFQPLGITTAVLELDASGKYIGSSYTYASARDWARLGLLFLQDGQWGEEQLLPKGWVEYSRTPTLSNPSNAYGAHIWLNRYPEGKAEGNALPSLPDDTIAMNGYQGQFVVIVPSESLVVVRLGFTAEASQIHGIEALVADSINALR